MGYGKHNGRVNRVARWPFWTGLTGPVSLPFENWAFWNSLLPFDRRMECVLGEGGWFLFARNQYVYSLNRQVICNVVGMGHDNIVRYEAHVDLGLSPAVQLSRADSLARGKWLKLAFAAHQRQLIQLPRKEVGMGILKLTLAPKALGCFI